MVQTLLHSLRIDPTVLLINGILFLVLVQVLDKLYWKPIMRRLDDRKLNIESAYQAVDDTRHEIDRLRSEYQQRLAQIEAEARGRIQNTVHDAQREREQMIARAREQADETMRQGGVSIETEMAEAVRSMRANLDHVAVETFEKATGAPADPLQRRLVEEYISQRATGS